MLEINEIGIKGPEDLKEALLIKTHPEHLAYCIIGMIDRWGAEIAIGMLSEALVGGDKPLIKPTKEFITEDGGYYYKLVDIIKE
jgi:hypothetical protein